MLQTRIKFFPKAQMAEEYLRIARIEGDENKVLDYLNGLLEERKGQLREASEMPLDCANCSDVFCVSVCRKGTFLLLESCCVMRNVLFTLTEIRGSLSYKFDN